MGECVRAVLDYCSQVPYQRRLAGSILVGGAPGLVDQGPKVVHLPWFVLCDSWRAIGADRLVCVRCGTCGGGPRPGYHRSLHYAKAKSPRKGQSLKQSPERAWWPALLH